MWESLFSLVSTLLIIVAVLALAYLFTKHVAGRLYTGGANSFRSKRMQVLEQLSLGKDQKLVIAKMGDDLYFLGITQSGVSCIEKIPQETAQKWADEDEQKLDKQPEVNFSDILRKATEKFNGKGGQS